MKINVNIFLSSDLISPFKAYFGADFPAFSYQKPIFFQNRHFSLQKYKKISQNENPSKKTHPPASCMW